MFWLKHFPHHEHEPSEKEILLAILDELREICYEAAAIREILTVVPTESGTINVGPGIP